MNAKLIDFGLAKNLKNILQKSETICGSPSYCAPEIVNKEKDYDGKSIDVWCLAVTLYAMLEAALPFDDDKGPKNLQSNIVNFNYHPPRYCSQESLQLFK